MKISLVLSIMILPIIVSCGGDSAVKEPVSVTYETPTSANTLVFAQDGDTIRLKVGEEISVKLDLPETIKNTGITWQPIEGWYEGPIEEFRTYRSLEGTTYYTDLQIRGVEAGQKILTLAPAKQRQAVHDERRTLTFIVK